jgi:hypothetical protein
VPGRLPGFPIVGVLLSVAALAWLAWLSPPSQWFTAKEGEARIAVPIDRLAPPIPIEEIRRDLSDLESQLVDLESATGSSELELQLEELESRVSDLESRLDSVSDLFEATGERFDSVEAAVEELFETQRIVSQLCDALAGSSGALYDLWITAC